MGYNSQAGQVGLGIQSVRATPVAATRFMRHRGGSLSANRDLLIPDPEIGGNRDIPQAYMGAVAYSGDYNFYARMEAIAFLMYAAMGAKSSSSSAGTNEVQTITITGTPTGGTYTLSFRGQTTTALDFDATSSEVDAALGALSSIGGAANVTCAGGPHPDTAITVTFSGTLVASDPPMITAASSLTGGTNPSIAITASTPGFAPMGTHIITPADTLPWLTVEERLGTALGSFRYTDAKVNTLHLECDANGYMMGTAGLLALTGESDFTAQTTPDWDESPMMVGSQVSVLWGGAVLPAKSFSFDLNNNIEDDDYRLGSISLADAVEKRREVKFGFTVRPDDIDMWKAATFGDVGETSPISGPAYQGSVTIQVDSFETIQGANTPYRLLMECPYAVMAPFKIEPSGDDVIQNDIEITAIRPDALVPILTTTVRNDLATVF